MSRGLGRWQRAMLDELQRREVFSPREVLPATHTRVAPLAVLRAAHWWASQGLIVVDVERQHWKRGALVWEVGVPSHVSQESSPWPMPPRASAACGPGASKRA